MNISEQVIALVESDIRNSELGLLLPDLVFNVLLQSAGKKMVVVDHDFFHAFVSWKVAGTLTGTLDGIAPTLGVMELDGTTFVDFSDQAIQGDQLIESRCWVRRFFDWNDLYRQAGIGPARQVQT